MKRLSYLSIILFSIIIFTSCVTPNIILDNRLKENTSIMEAKGRQGFQINQVIRFGEFETGKVKRSWTTSYTLPFIVTFKGAKEKLSFVQIDNKGNAAEVFGASIYREKELRSARRFFNITLDYKSYYAGTIALNKGQKSWDYVIFNPNTSHWENVTAGFAKNGEQEIEIKGVKAIEGQANIFQLDVYGYQFFQNGEAIGAVSILNNGRVWMREDLDDEMKLVLASLSSGLMVRNNIEER